jgi:hypothetical protein
MEGLEDGNYNKKHWRLFEMPKICSEEVVAYLKRSECNSDVEIRGCFVQIIPYKKEVQSGQGQNRKIGPSTVACSWLKDKDRSKVTGLTWKTMGRMEAK